VKSGYARVRYAGLLWVEGRSEEAEAAESTAREEQPKGVEPCRKRNRSRRYGYGGGLPPGVRRACHDDTAGDNQSHGDRDQAEAYDPLPWRVAEPIPQAVRSEVHGAWGPEGCKRARQGSGKSPYLPPDKTHHQDHVRPWDGLRHRETIGEFLIGHPAMSGDDEVAHIRQDSREAAKADR
jgi:hypothetical protein